MNLVASAPELCCDILWKKSGIASGYIYVKIAFAKKSVHNRFKRSELLYLVKQNIVHLFVCNLWLQPIQKFRGIDFSVLAFIIKNDRIFSDFQ